MSTTFPCAGIQIKLTKFAPTPRVELHATRYSEGDILLIGKADGKVSQDGGLNKPIRVDPRAQVDLSFTVQSDADEIGKPAYNPVGVSFFAEDGDLGMDDFPTRRVEADPFNRLMLTVHDANVHGKSYKFNLLIQKVATGEIGVIDPQINNS